MSLNEEKLIAAGNELDEILNQAVDLTNGTSSYITNIRFRVSNNEVTLDLYQLGPDPQNIHGMPIAHRTHRLILPLALAKNIGELLVDAMTSFEETMGVNLPLLPVDMKLDDVTDAD